MIKVDNNEARETSLRSELVTVTYSIILHTGRHVKMRIWHDSNFACSNTLMSARGVGNLDAQWAALLSDGLLRQRIALRS